MARTGDPQRWRSIVLDSIAGTEATNKASVHSLQAKQGLWAIAQDVCASNSCATVLLEHIDQQVGAGEDLTAALLNAHGRVQREKPDCLGARVIACRHARTVGTLELAWVGDMHALLLRGKQAIEIKPDTSEQPQKGGYLVTTERLQQLGATGKQRPRIDRNLVHAQRGDYLVLASQAFDLHAQSAELAQCLRGFGNLEYKARKMQGVLSRAAKAWGRFLLVQVA